MSLPRGGDDRRRGRLRSARRASRWTGLGGEKARTRASWGHRRAHQPWITTHGFASTSARPGALRPDRPCGISEAGVTSLLKETGKAPALDAVRARFRAAGWRAAVRWSRPPGPRHLRGGGASRALRAGGALAQAPPAPRRLLAAGDRTVEKARRWRAVPGELRERRASTLRWSRSATPTASCSASPGRRAAIFQETASGHGAAARIKLDREHARFAWLPFRALNACLHG